ncbi:MBL fold metallo-hydrolase [Brevibacillus reuszeri]|uniref:MBL fold metallo-hydrolase n=1 Tax=Brevibacillus reuszeri TaxID=54915 RepID=UPI00366DAA1E
MMSPTTPIKSPYFTLEQVADGVYAAIAKNGAGSMSNAGIIDLGEQTLVFDTMYTLQAGQALLDAAHQLFGRPVTLVGNSHFHMDHVGANQLFKDAAILSTKTTRTLMIERSKQFLEFARSNPGYPESVKQRLEQETDEQKQQELSDQLGDLLAMDASLSSIVPTPPTITFDGSLTLHGSKRTAIFIAMGSGHSACDSVLYLPDDEVMFAADLLFVKSHPSVQSGNVAEWIEILEHLCEQSFHTVVPGHGPVGEKKDIALLRQYLLDLSERAKTFVSLEQIPGASIPELYRKWTVPSLYERNLQYLFHQLSTTL